jgi:hypothetical protein
MHDVMIKKNDNFGYHFFANEYTERSKLPNTRNNVLTAVIISI